MKIETVNVGPIGDRSSDDYKLSIDGVIDESSAVFEESLYIKSVDSIEKFKSLKISEISTLGEVQFTQIVEEWKLNISLVLMTPTRFYRYQREAPFLSIEPQFDLKSWNKPYSLREMQQTFKDEALKMQIEFREDNADSFFFGGNDFSFIFPIANREVRLGEHFNNSIALFQELQSNVLKILADRVRPDLITTLFEFPAELKVACKQYLVYFAQFLADVGINATTSLEEKANKVLFTVIPEDGEVALANIKEALKIYMDAPEADNFREVQATTAKDIATIQWEANIHHLQGQIALSQAILQAKDETISALKLSLYQMNQMVSSSKPLSLQEGAKSEEPIIEGIVSVKKYEGKGFSINFPEILRRLKRRF